jgi:hypothetical protein
MAEMQRQIEEFVRSLNNEINQRARPSASSQQPGNSLIPVIEMRRGKRGGA